MSEACKQARISDLSWYRYWEEIIYHRQPPKVIQSLAGNKDTRSLDVYIWVFALELAPTLAVPFSGGGSAVPASRTVNVVIMRRSAAAMQCMAAEGGGFCQQYQLMESVCRISGQPFSQ
uniref:Site-specific recombinase n=1 Tax=Erwinia piriflorinigrans CFBP 5888 TaxID=1161919 RepID=V5Z2K7_9GAMM|nr:site-specific recombinase [Erwinia piriflorinigrans CFBP 5888]